MARTPKEGLDYFPLVTDFEDKVDLIIAEFGAAGIGILVSLWQKIYKNGYYINWDNDVLMLFARGINEEITVINAVINRCFDRKIFDKCMYENHGILTSRGIQKQYLKVCKDCRRKKVEMIREFCLLSKSSELLSIITDYCSINTEEIGINAEVIAINDSENTQRKEKGKRKESTPPNPPQTIKDDNDNSASLKKIYSTFSNNLHPITPIEAEALAQWLNEGMEAEVILWAIRQAVLHGKRNAQYINKILSNLEKDGITTVEGAEARERDRKRGNQHGNQPPHKPIELWTRAEKEAAGLTWT